MLRSPNCYGYRKQAFPTRSTWIARGELGVTNEHQRIVSLAAAAVPFVPISTATLRAILCATNSSSFLSLHLLERSLHVQ